MRSLGSNIIPGEDKYISVDEESMFVMKISKENPHSYAYYTLYKIVNYIEHFHD